MLKSGFSSQSNLLSEDAEGEPAVEDADEALSELDGGDEEALEAGVSGREGRVGSEEDEPAARSVCTVLIAA
jgi:hypothetical protein